MAKGAGGRPNVVVQYLIDMVAGLGFRPKLLEPEHIFAIVLVGELGGLGQHRFPHANMVGRASHILPGPGFNLFVSKLEVYFGFLAVQVYLLSECDDVDLVVIDGVSDLLDVVIAYPIVIVHIGEVFADRAGEQALAFEARRTFQIVAEPDDFNVVAFGFLNLGAKKVDKLLALLWPLGGRANQNTK